MKNLKKEKRGAKGKKSQEPVRGWMRLGQDGFEVRFNAADGLAKGTQSQWAQLWGCAFGDWALGAMVSGWRSKDQALKKAFARLGEMRRGEGKMGFEAGLEPMDAVGWFLENQPLWLALWLMEDAQIKSWKKEGVWFFDLGEGLVCECAEGVGEGNALCALAPGLLAQWMQLKGMGAGSEKGLEERFARRLKALDAQKKKSPPEKRKARGVRGGLKNACVCEKMGAD